MIFEPLYPCTRISRGELESSTAHEVMHPETIADPGRPREGVTGRAFLLGLRVLTEDKILHDHLLESPRYNKNGHLPVTFIVRL